MRYLSTKIFVNFSGLIRTVQFRNSSSTISKNYDVSSLKELDHERLVYRVIRLQRLVNFYERTANPVQICGKDKVRVEHPDPDQILRSPTSMRKIALKLLYVGWDYTAYAWEDRSRGQKFSGSTNVVERVLLEALSRQQLIGSISTTKFMNFNRCGRTDRNVSSSSQVVTIRARSNLDKGYGVWSMKSSDDEDSEDDEISYKSTYNEEGFRFDDTSLDVGEIPYVKLLNEALPTDIRVLAWAPISKKFNPRYDCRSRTYRYVMPRGNLDVDLMHETAQKFVGTHDFRNFCKRTEQNLFKHFTRDLLSIQVKPLRENQCEGSDLISATITGRSFLHNQIRMIMAALTWVGAGRMQPSYIDELLDVERTPRKPSYDLMTPTNLSLIDCSYDPENLHWRWDDEMLSSTAEIIADQYVDHAVKAEVLRNMYEDVTKKLKDDGLREMCNDHFAAASFGSKLLELDLSFENSKSIEEKQKSYEQREVRNLMHKGFYSRAARLFDEQNNNVENDEVSSNETVGL